MKPVYKEFFNDEEVVDVVQALKARNILEDDIYVITHDDDRTDRVADNADANKVLCLKQGLEQPLRIRLEKKVTSFERSLKNSVFLRMNQSN